MEWRKSTFCNADQPMCVEVRGNDTAVQIRDSDGDITEFTREEFGAFLAGVRAGEFDDLA